jgi:membrane protein required for colicin V production
VSSLIDSILSQMNVFDYIATAIVIISGFYGLMRGVVKEAVSLVAWFSAVWLAYLYSSDLSIYLASHIETQLLRSLLVVVVIFASVLIASSFVRRIAMVLIEQVGLGGLDHLLGFVFGLARGCVILMLIILVLDVLGFASDTWWQQSWSISKLSILIGVMPEHVPTAFIDVYRDVTGVFNFS